MCGPYWSQWSKTELDSMHGIEPEDYDRDDEDYDHDEEEGCVGRECLCRCCEINPCGNCMDCLGMSDNDFM